MNFLIVFIVFSSHNFFVQFFLVKNKGMEGVFGIEISEEGETSYTRDVAIPKEIKKEMEIHELLLQLDNSNLNFVLNKIRHYIIHQDNHLNILYDIMNVFEKREKNFESFINLLQNLPIDYSKYIHIFRNSIILRYLYAAKLITLEEIQQIQPKSVFWPEIYNLKKQDFSVEIQRKYEVLQANNFEKMKKFYRFGYLKNSINQILFSDNAQKLARISTQHTFDPNDTCFTNWFLGKMPNLKLSYISFAALYGSISCFKQLFLSGAKITNETMRCAIKGGNLEIIRICLDNTENLNIQQCLETALEYERNDIVDYLLLNYDIEMPSIITCAKYGNIRAILLRTDDINNVLARGNLSSLHFAVLNGNLLATKALVYSGANTDLASKDGRTALHLACLHGKTHIVSFLLEIGSDINVKTKEGETAREIAQRRQNTEVVNIIDSHNQTKIEGIFIPSIKSITTSN